MVNYQKSYHADNAALYFLQILICLVSAGLSAIAASFLSFWSIFMWIAIAIFVGIGVIVSFLILPLLFRKLLCTVTASQINVQSGIFLRKEQSIRMNTIQFVQIISGPFNGALGMNFIILHVYGGQLSVLFLSKKDCQDFTAYLRQKGVFYAP